MAFILNRACHRVDGVLSSQLEDLHLLIDLHTAVLSPHAPVKHLIKEYVPLVRLNGHLEHLLLKISIVKLIFCESKCGVVFA
jgi:hypothetical protein